MLSGKMAMTDHIREAAEIFSHQNFFRMFTVFFSVGSIAEGTKFVKTILIRCNLVQPVAVNKCAEIGQLFNYSQIKVNAKQATKYPKIISKLSKCKTSNKIYKNYYVAN